MSTTPSADLTLHLLLAIALAVFVLWWCVKPTLTPVPIRVSKRARALHPHTPDDCPTCRPAAPPPTQPAHYRQPGVLPRPQRKYPRGAKKKIDSHGYACCNSACDYYGHTEADFHALFGKRAHGQANAFKTCRIRPATVVIPSALAHPSTARTLPAPRLVAS
jgi:hypothetical protein